MQELLDVDRRLLLWLNGFHSSFMDQVMILITRTGFWIPLYLFAGFLIFRKYGRAGWFALAGAAVAILLADRITSGLMKPLFARLRPSHEPSLVNALHIVANYRGGLYGFASSHAANTFATATLLWLLFRETYKWTWLIFVWAAVMSYTRIYLGVHYPGDILTGAVIGAGSGWVGYQFFRWIRLRYDRKSALSG